MVEKDEILLVGAIYMGGKVDHGMQRFSWSLMLTKPNSLFMLVPAATILGLMIGGTNFLHFIENLEFLDVFYFVCSNVTILGHRDNSCSITEGYILQFSGY